MYLKINAKDTLLVFCFRTEKLRAKAWRNIAFAKKNENVLLYFYFIFFYNDFCFYCRQDKTAKQA